MLSGLLPVCFLILVVLQAVEGQVIGTDVCGCTPSVYEFTLDFSSTPCPAIGFDRGGASLRNGNCVSNVRDPFDDTADLVVDSVLFVEFNSRLSTLQRVRFTDLREGDTIHFTSVAAALPPIDNVNQVPAVLEVQIVLENPTGDRFVAIVVFEISNDCSIYPVFESDLDYVAWMHFGTAEPPLPELCPLAAALTGIPTRAPITSSPTTFPTSFPTNHPTEIPITLAPTLLPVTSSPTLEPFSMSMSMHLQRSLVERELRGEFNASLVADDQEFGRQQSRVRRKRRASSYGTGR